MSAKFSKRWENFEYATKRGLEAIGYIVERDIKTVGSQVDLYAELNSPLNTHRLLVECKDFKSSVGVDTIRGLYSIISALTKPNTPYSGLVVSRNGFTREAKDFAQNSGVWLLTLDDLFKLSFDPMPLVQTIIDSFDEDELGVNYVDLSCMISELGKGTIYKPVERFLDDYFSTTKRSGIAILGNFGTGKTSLCKHYAYLLANRWKEGHEAELGIPVYINLRDTNNLEFLEDTIHRVAKSARASLNISGVKTWLSNNKTLLILDGLDEMAVKMDRVAVSSNLYSLQRFCQEYNVKVLLTCRTHFFRTQVEENALGDLLRLYICDWGKDELIDYISKAKPEKSADVLSIILKTYNLEELSKTPIFLNMIVSSINDIGGRVNQSKLYQIYTDRWIDGQRHRSFLSPDEKRNFMEELAYKMFSTGRSAILYAELPSRIGDFFPLKDYQTLQAFDQDIRTCTFLVRDDDGRYRFVHRSYMEFFLASHLAAQVKQKKLERFGNIRLTKEIAGFFSNYFEKDMDFLMDLLVRNDRTIVRANAAMAISSLPFNERLQACLLLSLATEKENEVRYPIIDALKNYGTKIAISHIIDIAKRVPSCGPYCIRSLIDFIKDEDVFQFYKELLTSSEDMELINAVLEGIALSKIGIFSESLHEFIKKKWWRSNSQVVAFILRAVDALGTLQLARDLEKLSKEQIFGLPKTVDDQQIENPNIPLFSAVKDSLIRRFLSEINELAQKNRAQGLSYRQNEGSIRGLFGIFINNEALRTTLQPLYDIPMETKKSKSDRMKASDRKRASSGKD